MRKPSSNTIGSTPAEKRKHSSTSRSASPKRGANTQRPIANAGAQTPQARTAVIISDAERADALLADVAAQNPRTQRSRSPSPSPRSRSRSPQLRIEEVTPTQEGARSA